MTKEEIQANWPQAYNEIVQEGKDSQQMNTIGLIALYGSEAIEHIQNNVMLSQKEIAEANFKAEEVAAKRDKQILDLEMGKISDYE